MSEIVVVRGGGDLGSGVVARLWRAGLGPVVLEKPEPVTVRRTVAFSEAVWEGKVQIEEIVGLRVGAAAEALDAVRRGLVPVLVDPQASSLIALHPAGLVDAIMAKRNLGTDRSMAQVVVGLGPGFVAGDDVHAVVETNRGPRLGRVIWQGSAEPNTGEPGPVGGHTRARIVRASAAGRVVGRLTIGERVAVGDVVAEVQGVSVRAAIEGVLRGLVRDGLIVEEGMKIGDIDPRGDPNLCRLISDKALAVGGGAVEAVLARLSGRKV